MTIKVLACVTVALAVFAGDARAEIVVFKNGRTMSVKSCRLEDGTATIRLRSGGEVTFPADMIDRVDPDEVPYPDDRPAGDAVADASLNAVDTSMMLPEAVTGKPWNLATEMRGAKATVLAFIDSACPVCQNHLAGLNRLKADFAEKGLKVVGVYSHPGDTIAEVADHARKMKLAFPVLRDDGEPERHHASGKDEHAEHGAEGDGASELSQ